VKDVRELFKKQRKYKLCQDRAEVLPEKVKKALNLSAFFFVKMGAGSANTYLPLV